MASRVNTRFVILLGAGLGVFFAGAAGLLVMVRLRSGERYVARGDAAMAAGNYKDADRYYGTAVNKEQQNVEWLKKWREAMRRKPYTTPQQYSEDFSYYVGIHRQLSLAQKSDARAHRDYLDILLAAAELSGMHRGSWENLAAEAEAALPYFDESGGGDGQALRRYRGLARVRLLGAGFESEPVQWKEARQDLEAALAADPADSACAAALASWHQREADRAVLSRDAQAERRHMEEGRAVLDRALAADPRDAGAITARLRYRIIEAVRDLDSSRAPAEFVRARRERLDALKPALEEASASLRAADPADVDFSRAVEFYGAASTIDPAEGDRLATELIDRVLAARPDGVDLIYLRARLLQSGGEHEQAITMLQRIVDAPVLPVSVEGVRLSEYQKQALFLQATSAIVLAAAIKPGPERDSALRRAEAFREALVTRGVPADAPELLFLDAKRAIARENFREAAEKLAEFSRITGDNSPDAFEALTIRAQLASRFNQDGLAEELYEKALDLRPDAVPVRMALGEVQARLQHYADALGTYRAVLEADAQNPQAAERYAYLVELTGAGSGVVTDPVVKVMVQAEQLQSRSRAGTRNPEAAIALLERAMAEHKADPRLVIQLVKYQLEANDEAGARATLDRGLGANPEHEALRALRRRFEAAGSYELARALIDESEAPEIEKQMARYQLMRQYARHDEADALLKSMSDAAPDDPRIVEFGFIRAIDRKDLDEAQRLAEKARLQDLDGADGLTFLARLQLARGDAGAAVQTLRQAIDQGPESLPARQLLGQTLLNLGRGSEAVEAYRAALRLNPSDRETFKPLIVALARIQQPVEALRVARESEPFGRADPEFLHLLYELEAVAGLRRVAVEGRERIAARAPTDVRNGVALAQLYIDDRQWGKARALLDRLRAAQDSLPLVASDARWHADQGDMTRAKQVYVDYLEKQLREQSEPPGPEPYLAFGEFLIQRGEIEAGLGAIAEGAKYQSARREADLFLADRLVSMGRHAEAEPIYRALLDSGVQDPELQITARHVECLFQQGKVDEAEARLNTAGAAADGSVPLLMLRAAIAERRNDARRAREVLNGAIERFPDQHLPYFRRALLASADREFIDDALADLDRCISLRPDFWPALTTRASINFSRGREAEGLRDLRAAVEANPRADDLRVTVVLDLIRRGREQEAFAMAQDGIKQRPNDAALVSRLGDAFAGQGLWNRAGALYSGLWEARRDEWAAALYAIALLRSTPAALSEAEAVLTAPTIRVDNQPALLALRALLRIKQNQETRAVADAGASYSLSVTDARHLKTWYDAVMLGWPEPGARERLLDTIRPREGDPGWCFLFRAEAIAADPTRRPEAIDMLERVGAETKHGVFGIEVYRALDSLYRDAGDFEKALGAAKKGLTLNERDAVLNNNAAAYLAEKLGRAEEALPFALKAREAAPASPAVLDTLAGVHIARKDWTKAEEVLAEGLRIAQSPPDKAKFLLGQVRVRVEAADQARAREATTQLRRLLEDNPAALNDEQKKTLSDLETRTR